MNNKYLKTDKRIKTDKFWLEVHHLLKGLQFFKDEKYSLLDKSEAWLLCSNNQVVWVVGIRQDDRFIINSETKKILKIAIGS